MALRHGMRSAPRLVKPNAGELRRCTGVNVDGIAAARQAVEALRAMGAEDVAASLGGAGLLAVTGEGAWHARLGEQLAGNPTGAGDACVAALAAGQAAGTPWPQRLADAVALSAAAVLSPVAGAVDPAVLDQLRQKVLVDPC